MLKRMTVTIDPELCDEISELAWEQRISRSECVSNAIQFYIENSGNVVPVHLLVPHFRRRNSLTLAQEQLVWKYFERIDKDFNKDDPTASVYYRAAKEQYGSV